ncbi:MAG: dicarboxylate/amino acid:cation symporter [Desulfobacteraceae bacterium]|nr:dicarboxylate/amino acid:cation symporter [Desulfobacteraceae bacterium]
MKKKKRKLGLISQMVIGIAVGVGIGLVVGRDMILVIMTIKYCLGQLIFFTVPLVIIGFIAPAITGLKDNASKMLGSAILIAYLSAAGAATMAAIAGYIIIPDFHISREIAALHEVPKLQLTLDIPPIMPVMTALVTAIILGVAVLWAKAKLMENLLKEFEKIVLSIINKIVIPVLPFFIATTFAQLAYSGSLTEQLPVFIKVIGIVLLGHFIWLTVLYSIAGVISGKNPFQVFRHYGPAYMTAVGTMSSAATLPVSLECAHKSEVLNKEVVDFMIPMGATIHLCGSVLTETFFAMTISMMLYGTLPTIGTMVLFILLFGVFAIGAPGVPGGTVMASLGIVVGVLGFDPAGVALLLAIFALQDSFGTACNITGDGAIALMLEGLFYKDGKPKP